MTGCIRCCQIRIAGIGIRFNSCPRRRIRRFFQNDRCCANPAHYTSTCYIKRYCNFSAARASHRCIVGVQIRACIGFNNFFRRRIRCKCCGKSCYHRCNGQHCNDSFYKCLFHINHPSQIDSTICFNSSCVSVEDIEHSLSPLIHVTVSLSEFDMK